MLRWQTHGYGALLLSGASPFSVSEHCTIPVFAKEPSSRWLVSYVA